MRAKAWQILNLVGACALCEAAFAITPIPKVIRVEPLVKWGGTEQNRLFDSAQEAFAVVQPRYDRDFIQCGGWDAGCYKWTALSLIPLLPYTVNGFPQSGYKWSVMWERKVGNRIESGYSESAQIVPTTYCPTAPFSFGLRSSTTGTSITTWCEGVIYAEDPVCSDDGCPGKPHPRGLGNPLLPEVRVKNQREVDYISPNGLLQHSRTYRSDVKRGFQRDMPTLFDYSGTAGSRLPGCLVGNAQIYERDAQGNYVIESYCFPYVSAGIESYQWVDGEGRQIGFIKQGDGYVTGDNYNVRTFRLASSGNWVLVQEDNSYAIFAPGGRLLSEHRAGGGSTTYQYGETSPPSHTAPTYISLTDSFGRQARINYNDVGQLESFVDPAGGTIRYSYDITSACGRNGCPKLHLVRHADNAEKKYHWNEPTLAPPAARAGDSLTGMTDELGIRVGWYEYDSAGQALLNRPAFRGGPLV